MNCQICGGAPDLLMSVGMGSVCAVCTMRVFGGANPTQQHIQEARNRLNLADGEFLKQDRGAEAARILGMK